MRENKQKIELGVEVDVSDLDAAYDEILDTNASFLKKIFQQDAKYHKKIRSLFTVDVKKFLTGQKDQLKGLAKFQKKKEEIHRKPGASSFFHPEYAKLVGRGTSATKLPPPPPPSRPPTPPPAGAGGKGGGGGKGGFGLSRLAGDIFDEMGAGRIKRTMGSPVLRSTKDVIDKTIGAGAVKAGKGLEDLALRTGKLGVGFSALGKTLGLFGGVLGTGLTALIALIYEADVARKTVARRMVKGVGISGTGVGTEFNNLIDYMNAFAIKQNAMVSRSLRLTNEEIQHSANILMQSGVTVKNLGGSYEAFVAVTETAAEAGIAFGRSVEEGSQMVGEFYERTGASINRIKKTYASLNQNIKDSNMTANNFLSTIQSVTAQFNLFLDSTVEFSKVLSKLSKSGLSQRQTQRLVDSIAAFGAKDFDDGIRMMALAPEEMAQAMKDEVAAIDKQIENLKKTETSPAEIAALYRRREEVEADMNRKGGLQGAFVGSMSPFRQLSALLKKQGLTTTKALKEASLDPAQLKIFSKIFNVTEKEMKDILDAVGILSVTNNDVLKVLDSQGDEAKEIAQLSKDARDLQEQSVTKLSGVGEVTNALLIAIGGIIEDGFNAVKKWFGVGSSDVFSEKNIEKYLKEATDLLLKGTGAIQTEMVDATKRHISDKGVTDESALVWHKGKAGVFKYRQSANVEGSIDRSGKPPEQPMSQEDFRSQRKSLLESGKIEEADELSDKWLRQELMKKTVAGSPQTQLGTPSLMGTMTDMTGWWDRAKSYYGGMLGFGGSPQSSMAQPAPKVENNITVQVGNEEFKSYIKTEASKVIYERDKQR